MFSLLMLAAAGLTALLGEWATKGVVVTGLAAGRHSENERRNLVRANYCGVNPIIDRERFEKAAARKTIEITGGVPRPLSDMEKGVVVTAAAEEIAFYTGSITEKELKERYEELKKQYPDTELLDPEKLFYAIGDYCLTRAEMYIVDSALVARFLKQATQIEIEEYKRLSERRLAVRKKT